MKKLLASLFGLAALILSGGVYAQTPGPMVPTGSAVSGNGYPTTYTGITGTRGRVAYATGGAGITWTMSQIMGWANDTMVPPTVLIPCGWYVNTSNAEVTSGTGCTLGASICAVTASVTCLDGASYTLCGTSRTQAFSLGVAAITCSGVIIPNGSQYRVRILQSNPSGAVFSQVNGQSVPASSGPDCWKTGTGTANDLLTSGTFASNECAGYSFFYLAVVSPTQKPGVAIIGDSRAQGGIDFPNDASGNIGDIERSIGTVFGFSNLAVASSFCTGYVTGPRTYRDPFIQTYATHVVSQCGINDISSGGRTAAQVASSRSSIAGFYPNQKVFGTTIPVATTSSDKWTTLTNQGAANVNVPTFNQLARQGIAGEAGYFDIAYALDPAHQNLWPPAANPFASALSPVFSGTASINTSGVMTVTACSVCTLPIGTQISGTNVPLGGYVVGYGTNVSSAGVCTATCTYTVLPLSAAVASTTITAAGFFAPDGLHLSPQGEQYLKDIGAIDVNMIKR